MNDFIVPDKSVQEAIDALDVTTIQWETERSQSLRFTVWIEGLMPPKAPNCRCVLIGADEPDRQRALSRVLGLIHGPGQRLREQVKDQTPPRTKLSGR